MKRYTKILPLFYHLRVFGVLSVFLCFIAISRLEALEDSLEGDISPSKKTEAKSSLFSINPIFGDYGHRLALVGMMGFDETGFLRLGDAGIHYSQPNRFFRLPGRLSMELERLFGADDFGETIFGISQDVVLPLMMDNLYFGIGLGIYIRSQVDSYIGSAFNFGQKVFLGYRFKKVNQHFDIGLEFFIKHYSNGSLRLPNIGFNFLGLGVAFIFGDK